MADLSNLLYSSLQTAVGDWIARSDLTTNIPDFIALFEAEANRTLRTRQMESMALLYPASSTTFNVTGTSSNGLGAIRVTVSNTTTTTGLTGEVFVQNVGGTVEANNTWIATNVSSTSLDLNASSFINAWTSGGTVSSPSGQAALPSDFLSLRRATWTGTPNKVLEYVAPDILRRYHPIISNVGLIFDSSFPSMFTVEGNNAIFRPIDPSAVEFQYYQKIPALASQTSSTNWLLTTWPDLYLAGSLAECYVFQRDWDEAGLWKTRRDDMFERITKLDQKTRGPAPYVKVDMAGMIP